MALVSNIAVSISALLTKTGDLVTATAPLAYAKAIALASGVAAGQCDLVFQDHGTIAPSATTKLDLSGGGLTDPNGTVLVFVKLKMIYVYATAANTNNVVVTRPAAGVAWATTAADAVPVPPGGEFLLIAPGAGWSVGAAATDEIDLVNSAGGTSVDYDIILLGTSA